MPLFDCPPERREGLEAVKKAVGIHHPYLDGWIYLFYENKKFDFKETVAKLQRRDDMEKKVFANYEITPSLHLSMRAGIVQYIGRDKAGRPVLYFNTVRDSPTADQRPERQANMDMFLSWAVRCDPVNPTATVTWLINQQDASLMRNTDIIFQKDMALRISKFFPGVVAKMYICNMGSALTFVMKPLLKQLPKSISDCIFLYSAGDIRRGKLLEVIDADVLPLAMGGNNNIDHKQNYELFATTIEDYFSRCQCALRAGISIKEMEMMEAFPVDRHGAPQAPEEADIHGKAERSVSSPGSAKGGALPVTFSTPTVTRVKRIEEAGEETLDLASPVVRSPSTIRVDRNDKTALVIMSASLHKRHARGSLADACDAGSAPGALKGEDGKATDSSNMDEASPNASQTSLLFPMEHKGSSAGHRNGTAATPPQRSLTFFHSHSHPDMTAAAASAGATPDSSPVLDSYGLPTLHIDTIAMCSITKNIPSLLLSHEAICELQRCWTLFLCHCVTLLPQLLHLMESLRDGDVLHDDVLRVQESIPLIRRVMHHTLDLFPQTTQPLCYPIFHWLTAGVDKKGRRLTVLDTVKDRVAMDCTSPDNLLLSVQGTAVEYVDECEKLLEEDKMKDRILRRVVLAWPGGVGYENLVSGLQTKVGDLWRQVVPLFQKYIEAKVAMSIGEFIDYYGLLASGGRIDTRAAWYNALFSGLVQYRELHRKNWLFHVYPPAFHRVRGSGATSTGASRAAEAAPSMAEMLQVHGGPPPTLGTVSEFILLVEHSLHGTREQLGVSSVAKIASHLTVERYMEETGTKVYIPYEAQLSGVKPKELVAAQKEAARQLLEAVEAPLKELLFLAAILFILERGVSGDGHGSAPAEEPPTAPTREAVLRQVNFARQQSQDMAEVRRGARRIAVTIAKAAYEVQGTFGGDAASAVLCVYGTSPSSEAAVRPDGYAVALNLLLVEALVTQQVAQASPPVNESFAFSMDGCRLSPASMSPFSQHINSGHRGGPSGITVTPPTPPLQQQTGGDSGTDDDDDMKSACSAEAVDVGAFLDTIAAMDTAATPLAAAKRQLLRQSSS